MSQLTIYIDSGLTPRWNEWPKEPSKPGVMSHQEFFTEYYEDDLPKYRVALQKAKEEAIPFDDESGVRKLCYQNNKDKPLIKINSTIGEYWSEISHDSFVTIDYDGTVEVKEACNYDACTMEGACGDYCKIPVKVARLIPSKPNEVSPEVPDRSEKIYPTKPNNVVVQCCPHCNGELIIDIELQQYPDFKKFTLYDESIRTVSGSNTTPYVDKPDFEAMAKEWLISWDNDDKSRGQAFIAGMEKIWSDLYLPKVAEMQKKLDNAEGRFRDKEKEMDRLKELIHKESVENTGHFRKILELQSRIKELEEEIKTLKG